MTPVHARLLAPLRDVRQQLVTLVHRARPAGSSSALSQVRWQRRHMVVTIVCVLHVVGIFLFGLLRGFSPAHVAIDVTPIAATTALGSYPFRRRRVRSMFTTLATVFASAAIVHLSGGIIEAHFHYFVMIGVISLYQDWAMYGAAIAFVVIDHGLAGVIDSAAVYNHHAAASQPWRWAAVHGVFYLAGCVTSMVSWWQTEYAAAHDPLTMLPNRSTFENRLAALRLRAAHRIAVVFIDLDGFKAVNDGLGHHVGDELLRSVGNRLEQCMRSRDLVVRLGGDEFAVLLEGVDCIEDVEAAAERVMSAFLEPFMTTHMPVRVSASVGIATSFTSGSATNDLLRHADIAMRSAKSSGKRKYCIFELDTHGGTLLRASFLSDLKDATASGQIGVHYQPIVDLQTNEVVGMEALARWHHPTRGEVSPSVFIPLAEEVGLIGEVGAQVLSMACREAARWTVGPDGKRPYLSVNLSPWQFHQENIVVDVLDHVLANGLEPGEVVLEITESALMDSTDDTMRMLRELRALGFRLAIDDFGTGYSSLGYLQSFPIHMLKVDKAFVDGVDRSDDGGAIARAIIRLADSLGLQVIAEGVERASQAEQLLAFGCHHAQGHLYASATAEPNFDATTDIAVTS